jgi:2-(1,2-epoxy-1,2-dihydrophenyl)acetyl-CoA isomerase
VLTTDQAPVPGARGVHDEAAGPVGRITLSRPESANAMDLPAARAFGEAVSRAAEPSVRSVLLTGDGRRFCAGGDVSSFLHAEDRAGYLLQLATELERHLRRLSELDKPVVAGVHGAVAGAGLGLLLSSDVVVAGRSTKFLMAYPDIGLIPDCGVSYPLPRAVGQQRALRRRRPGGRAGLPRGDGALPSSRRNRR